MFIVKLSRSTTPHEVLQNLTEIWKHSVISFFLLDVLSRITILVNVIFKRDSLCRRIQDRTKSLFRLIGFFFVFLCFYIYLGQNLNLISDWISISWKFRAKFALPYSFYESRLVTLPNHGNLYLARECPTTLKFIYCSMLKIGPWSKTPLNATQTYSV